MIATLACTQELSQEIEETNSQPISWARLLSVNKLFTTVQLVENETSFGRGKKSDVVWESKEILSSKYYATYSGVQFKVVRDEVKNYVYLVDLSSNGTFVNGTKVGKNKRHVIQNNDEISISTKSHRVYIFIDANFKEDSSIAEVVRDKYIVSKPLGRGAYGEVRLCFLRGKISCRNSI